MLQRKKYFWVFTVLTLIYIGLIFVSPIDPDVIQKYNITETRARYLSLTILAPLIVIYYCALYGFHKFRSYALQIYNSKEGNPLLTLSNGLGVLAFMLPTTGIISTVTNNFELKHPEILVESTIIKNYIALAFALTAFMLIARGGEELVNTLKTQPKLTNNFRRISLISIITISCIYTWLITTRLDNSASEDHTYFLPNWLIITTIAIPYLYAWCRGVIAVYQLYLYKSKVRGIIYKKAIDFLYKGIAAIIALSVSLQLLTTLSERLNQLNLTPFLFIIYLLVITYALGFGLVVKGANKLRQIEEA
jgi:hypothetical protein